MKRFTVRWQYLAGAAAMAMVLLGQSPSVLAQDPVNIAPLGDAVFGYHTVDDGTLGTDYEHVGIQANVADGNMLTRSDTWGSFAGAVPYDYVGVVWDTPQENLQSIRLTMATFVDGGWFGTPLGGFPPPGKALTPDDLLAPKVQFTLDGGATWFDLPGVTDNYVAVMTGHNIGGGGFINPTTSPTSEFLLPEIGGGIGGLRLFGEGGGFAGDDSTGFIGVYEFEVLQGEPIPEPASLLTLASGLVSLMLFRRRTRR